MKVEIDISMEELAALKSDMSLKMTMVRSGFSCAETSDRVCMKVLRAVKCDQDADTLAEKIMES